MDNTDPTEVKALLITVMEMDNGISYDHDAIYKAYPNACNLNDDSTGVLNLIVSKITIVQSNVDAARFEKIS